MAKFRPDEKNIHCGHRKRVIESYDKIDFDTLSPHQVLEYILFYVFPRSDVNPLAHRLLSKYGTVQSVLDADPTELSKVYGVGEQAARMISGFPKIFNYYISCKLSKKYFFKTDDDIFDYCEELLRLYNHEVFFVIAVDPSFHVINKRMLGVGGVKGVQFDTHDICNFINETKAANLLITHNHPGGFAIPTVNDIEGTEIVKELVGYMSTNFLDHIIVGSDGIYSMAKNEKVRDFSTDQNIQEFAEFIKGVQ